MSPYSIKAGIVVVVITVILLDIYLAVDNRKGNTYSEIFRGWFKRMRWLYYTAAFWSGVLLSHWGLK